MKKIVAVLLSCMMCISLAACGSSDTGRTDTEADVRSGSVKGDSVTDNSGADTAAPQDADPQDSAEKEQGSKTLVAYFSLAGEQYEVGVIKKGNTQIVAEMIAEQTGADTFQIEPVKEYPDTYDGLLEVSKEESEDNPPEIASEELRYYHIGIESPVIEVSGNQAVLTSTSALTANAYGTEGTFRMEGTSHYERRDGNWIMINNSK